MEQTKIFKILIGFVFIIHGFLSAQTTVEILGTASEHVCAGDIENYEIENITLSDIPAPSDIKSGTSFLGIEFAWDVVEGELFDLDDANYGVLNQETAIIWDDECIDGQVIGKARVKYTNTDDDLAYLYLSSATHDVTIHKAPDAVTISSSTTVVECDEEIELTFTASDDCMINYNWTYPATWSYISGAGTNILKVKTDKYTGGEIQVEVSYPYSASINCLNVTSSIYTITRDCPPNELYTVPTTSLTEHTAVDDYIRVEPSGGTIEVLASDVVRFKAGSYIRIKPGFKVHANAAFTAKIGACVSCTAFRVGLFDEEENVDESDIIESQALSILLCPNPSNGLFDISFKGEEEDFEESYLLHIHDLNGRLVLSQKLDWGKESIQIDLSTYPKGIYICTMNTPSTTFQEKIVIE